MTPKIAIIGAGPGGCILARLLNQHSIPCTIFESERSTNYRSQGGTLDLRRAPHARYDGESSRICDKNMTTWLKRAPGKQGEKNAVHEALEIDRVALRKMLMESLPEGCGFDIIVGADGAFSKTRSCLSSEKPLYSGVAGYNLSIPDAANKAPEAYKLINCGSVFSYSDLKALDGQQLGDGSLNVSCYVQYDEDFTSKCGFDVTDLQVVKKELRKKYHDWAPELVDLVEKAEGDVHWRNLYMLPVGFQWEHKKGVTLLGDAAHLMTPFAGIGVNTAFYDAMLLCRAIVEHTEAPEGDDLDARIIAYEKEMFTFAKEQATMTEGAMNDMLLNPGAPRSRIESYVLRFAKPEFPKWAPPLLTVIVHTVFFFYKLFV